MNSLEKLNIPNVSLRQISMLISVVNNGSIRSAANDLGVTQGAVSQGIKEAEKQLGVQLFNRNGRKLTLNSSGRVLLPRMEELIRQAIELNDILQDESQQQKGHLYIGASSTIGCYVLPGLIAAFQIAYPQIKIDLNVRNTKDIILDLNRGVIDLAFVEGEVTSSDISIKPFMTDKMVVFSHPEHPLTKRRSVSWKQLANETWLLREDGSGTHSYFLSHCIKENLEFQRTIHIGNSEAIIRSVEAGLGISCLSSLSVQRSLDIGTLMALPVKPILRRFHFVRKCNQHFGKAENLFLKKLESHPLICQGLSSEW